MNLANVDLNLLRALDALLTERNVTRAAERLAIGQPAMSAALGRLRKLFDDPLLVRSGAEMVATPLAESLGRPVREAMTAIHAVLAARESFDPGVDPRTFTVVASDYVALILLRPLLRRLRTIAPRVRLVVQPVSENLISQIGREQVDVAIVPHSLVPPDANLERTELFSDRHVVAVAADNTSVGTTVTIDDLRRLSFLTAGGDPLPALGQRQLAALGVPSSLEIASPASLVAPFLLTGSDLAVLVLERLGRALAEVSGIRLVEPPVALESVTECLYWNPRRTEDSSHRWLRGLICESARSLSPAGEPSPPGEP